MYYTYMMIIIKALSFGHVCVAYIHMYTCAYNIATMQAMIVTTHPYATPYGASPVNTYKVHVCIQLK